jgi:hypothetical protein
VLLAVCIAWADPGPVRDRRRRAIGGTAVALLVAAGVAAAVQKHRTFDAAAAAAVEPPRGIFVTDVAGLRRTADLLAALADRHRAPLVLFSSHADSAEVYGVPTLTGRRVETLFPPGDRRTWHLRAESTRVRDRLLLFADREPWVAERAWGAFRSVEQVSASPLVLRIDTDGSPAVEVAERLGLRARPH